MKAAASYTNTGKKHGERKSKGSSRSRKKEKKWVSKDRREKVVWTDIHKGI
jgi:hypothetical protein